MSSGFRFAAFFLLLLLTQAQVFGFSLSGFSPGFGSSSDLSPVSIFGSGFTGGTGLMVKFNGVASTSAGVVADGQINAFVPAAAPLGSGPIVVILNGVQQQTATNFTVIGPGPYITGCDPITGDSTTQISITGVHFTGATGVTFAGKAGQNLSATSDTLITVYPPLGVVSGPIVVTTPKGSATNSSDFYVAPVVTGFSPSSGRTSTNLLIRGTNFLGASSVVFAGTGGAFTLSVTPTVLSNLAMTVSIPTNVVTGACRVIAPAGSFDTTSNFVVLPTIYGFSPAFGAVGTSVTITGANFNVGTPQIRFNGTLASISGLSFGQVTAAVPSTASSGPISVTTTDGSFTTPNFFYLPPTITSFSPTNGAAGTWIKIAGNNFTNAISVTFSNGLVQTPIVTNNTTLGVQVPAGALTGPLVVTTPGGSATSSGLFYGTPGIGSFAPTHGLPGTLVSLSGSNFIGVSSVQFAGLPAPTVYFTNNNSLGVLVPNGAQTGPLTIVTPGGTNTTSSNFVLDYTADLSVSLGASSSNLVAGNNLIYTIAVYNNTPYPAPNTVITDTLPSTVYLKSAVSSQGTLNTANLPTITGNLTTLTNGSPAVITLTVLPFSGGFITNTISVSSDYPDPVLTNNTASAVTTIVPKLRAFATGTNTVIIGWPAPSTGFKLLQNLDLNTTNWTLVTNAPFSAIVTNLTLTNENEVVLPPQNAHSSFRLKYP